MKVLFLCAGILMLQSCARLQYESFLSTERKRIKNDCILNDKLDEKTCEQRASKNIEEFRRQIEK